MDEDNGYDDKAKNIETHVSFVKVHRIPLRIS